MAANPYTQYQNNSILTASRGELTLMLYNGAIKFCNIALEALEKKDIQKAHINIIKTQDIIQELQITLDMKYELSDNIDKLYEYIKELLIDANIEKDMQKLIDAKSFITEFRDMWQQVMKIKA